VNRVAAIRAFFGTPKGLLILILSAFVLMAAPYEGVGLVAPGLLAAVGASCAIDAVILRARWRRWFFPSGAMLTALIVAMVLRVQEPWYVTTITSIAAVLSKYLFRSRAANVFNPAALGIVATYYFFSTGQSWWGALPGITPLAQVALVAGGVFIADRVNRMPLVLAFLGVYYLLFTIATFTGDPQSVVGLFRTPDLQAALFFAFIILTDPPTSPVRYSDQVVCGAIVALASYTIFYWVGAVYYLLAGVLIGNLWEAWRRVARRNGRTFPGGIGAFLREVSPWRPT
jgi:Na+-translocating ferredoxin:NAD+ oxidoreductase RnfD subunit